MKLYRNNRQGRLRRRDGAPAALARVVPAMGANFGDIDNDGFLDMYIGTGAPSYAALVPNVMFRNRRRPALRGRHGSQRPPAIFRRATASRSATSTATADRRSAGNIGGFVPGDAYWKALFKNPGNANCDRRAAGRRQDATARRSARRSPRGAAPDGRIQSHRVVTSGGSFGASPFVQHIGLGKGRTVKTLEVLWPASNTRQPCAMYR